LVEGGRDNRLTFTELEATRPKTRNPPPAIRVEAKKTGKKKGIHKKLSGQRNEKSGKTALYERKGARRRSHHAWRSLTEGAAKRATNVGGEIDLGGSVRLRLKRVLPGIVTGGSNEVRETEQPTRSDKRREAPQNTPRKTHSTQEALK